MLNFPSQLEHNLLGICLLLWVIIEYRVLFKRDKRPKKNDRKALSLFSVLILMFCVSSILIYERNLGSLGKEYRWIFWVGILIIAIGVAIRQHSIHIMGGSYVATLQVQEKPQLIQTGPFKLVRHPCYTGFMISLWGLGIALLNWLFLLLIIFFSIIVFLIQIKIEERELEAFFGEEYKEYKKTTKKILPYFL
ncbi:isoprenylcysteine carboxylmethyltransferase family protein [Priestia sp. SB1]|uniref:methyltransferase family protein n=1 Tax=Priestia sp. SB1 TaxID=3132359 RepID=UPI00317E0E79